MCVKLILGARPGQRHPHPAPRPGKGGGSVSEVRFSTHHCAKEMVPLIFDSSSA